MQIKNKMENIDSKYEVEAVWCSVLDSVQIEVSEIENGDKLVDYDLEDYDSEEIYYDNTYNKSLIL